MGDAMRVGVVRERHQERWTAIGLFLLLLMCTSYTLPRWADPNQNSRLDMVVAVVEDQGGMLGEIKTIHIGKGNKTRDLDIYTAGEEVFDEILKAIKDMDGVDILEVRDVVQEIHAGGKIEVSSRVEVETIDDLSVVYTPGVASICKLISEKHHLAEDFTSIPRNVTSSPRSLIPARSARSWV